MSALATASSRGGIGRRKGLKILRGFPKNIKNTGALRVCSLGNARNHADFKKSVRHNFVAMGFCA